MLRDVILGLLRDERPHHGYFLIAEYKRRVGLAPGPGNFYRELGHLLRRQLIEGAINPPGDDPRRRPYRISRRGAQAFDQWLATGRHGGHGFWERLLFLDRLPAAARERLLRQRENALAAQVKTIEVEVQLGSRAGGPFHDLAPMIQARRLRSLEAELASVRDIRASIAAWLRRSDPPAQHTASATRWTGSPAR